MIGLSPLARGTPRLNIAIAYTVRFIPAGAGNTTLATTSPEALTVYPRWRGEHWLQFTNVENNRGLSPLARGTHMQQITNHQIPRFIPAGAGNTLVLLVGRYNTTVYPRWRGEHSHYPQRALRRAGLSPLARGTPLKTAQTGEDWRFIPAGAGNTRIARMRFSCCSVYPRWRGEHFATRRRSCAVRGLSPLARGTPVAGKILSVIIRFIPAGAGNTH